MISKFYKFFSVILFSILTIFLIFFLYTNVWQKNNKSKDSELVLNIWTTNVESRFEKYMTYIIEKYEKLNKNVKVYWEDFSSDEIVLKLYETWQNESLPDIVSLSTKSLINDVNSTIFVDLYGFDEKDLSIFFDGLLNSNEKDGRLLGLPWYTDIKVLFINKEIMDNSGISIDQYPKTEEQFLNLLSVIKENSQKFGSILEPNNLKNLIFNGLNIIDENGNVKIDTEEIIEHFKFYRNQFEYLSVPREFSNFDDKISLYANGEVAMIKSNFQFISSIEKISKEVYDNTMVFPIPLGKDNIRYSDTVNLSVIDNGKNIEQAMSFVDFILNETNQIELINNFNVLPVNKNIINIDNFIENTSKINESKIIAFNSLENSKDFVYNIQYQNDISNIIEKYSRSIYLDSYVNVETLIREAQFEINSLYNRE